MPKRGASPASNPVVALRREREKRGIRLEQVMEQTKLSRRFLEAIEAGRLDELPGGIFTISYLRQYARAVGLNEEQLISRVAPVPEPAAEPKSCQRESAGRTWMHQGWLRLFLG